MFYNEKNTIFTNHIIIPFFVLAEGSIKIESIELDTIMLNDEIDDNYGLPADLLYQTGANIEEYLKYKNGIEKDYSSSITR